MLQSQNNFITTFETLKEGLFFLKRIEKEFLLNEVDFNNESPEIYNKRVKEIFAKYGLQNEDVAIVDKGRVVGEKSMILVIDGNIKGYGFLNLNYQLTQRSILETLITPLANSLLNRHLLHAYLRKNSKVKVLKLSEQKPYHNE